MKNCSLSIWRVQNWVKRSCNSNSEDRKVGSVKANCEKCHTLRGGVVSMLRGELLKCSIEATKFITNQEQVTAAELLTSYRSSAAPTRNLWCFTASKSPLWCVCNACTSTWSSRRIIMSVHWVMLFPRSQRSTLNTNLRLSKGWRISIVI